MNKINVAKDVPKTKAILRARELTDPAIPKYLRSTVYKVTTYLHNQPDVFLHGFHVAFYFSTFLVLVTWVLGLFRLLGRKK